MAAHNSSCKLEHWLDVGLFTMSKLSAALDAKEVAMPACMI